MAIFGSEPTLFQTLISYIYQYVIMASVVSLAFFFYLIRTKAPLKEKEKRSETSGGEIAAREKIHQNGIAASSIVANGTMEVSATDQAMLDSILHGMNQVDELAAEDEAEETRQVQKVARERKATENEEEEESGGLSPKRRHVIREVTVRKIFLPPDTHYSEVENAAKRLIGDGEMVCPRKDSGTGGADFSMAIRNIREASKRLEDDDLSPVPRANGL